MAAALSLLVAQAVSDLAKYTLLFEVLVSCQASKGLTTRGFAFMCLLSSIFKTCHIWCSANKIPLWLTSSYI